MTNSNNILPTREQRLRQQRGTIWQCPHCGNGFPLAEAEGRLVPVQLTILKALHPIANIVDPNGMPSATNLNQLLKTSQCRPIFVLVPHLAICVPAMRAQGIPPEIYAGVDLTTPRVVTSNEGSSDGEPQ